MNAQELIKLLLKGSIIESNLECKGWGDGQYNNGNVDRDCPQCDRFDCL